jgi:hypothetical protein
VHHKRKKGPAANPYWLTISERRLSTGIVIFGAIGSGKTSCCMYPFSEQILAYHHDDHRRRIGGLILEVKGDLCFKVREILARHGRERDYIEMRVGSEYCYNPLHNDLEAYALAYGIASLLNNLFGRGKEPFWQQAYTNLVKFLILLHKVLYDYVTLFDVYECAINPDLVEARIAEGAQRFTQAESILIERRDYQEHAKELATIAFSYDQSRLRFMAAHSVELETLLKTLGIGFEIESSTDDYTSHEPLAMQLHRRAQFEAVRRWFFNDRKRIEPKLRTSIVEGLSVFLSLFDDNPAVKRTFCPRRECYDPVLNRNGKYGIPLPPFSDLIEVRRGRCSEFSGIRQSGARKDDWHAHET